VLSISRALKEITIPALLYESWPGLGASLAARRIGLSRAAGSGTPAEICELIGAGGAWN